MSSTTLIYKPHERFCTSDNKKNSDASEMSDIKKEITEIYVNIPGILHPITVLYPASKLPVCLECKKQYKSRTRCRKKHPTTLPWSIIYVCLTFDDSCYDSKTSSFKRNGTFQTNIMDFKESKAKKKKHPNDWIPYKIRENSLFSPLNTEEEKNLTDTTCTTSASNSNEKEKVHKHVPMCMDCKRKKYTTAVCRGKNKPHGYLPWSTVYNKVSCVQDESNAQETETTTSTDTEKEKEKEKEKEANIFDDIGPHSKAVFLQISATECRVEWLDLDEEKASLMKKEDEAEKHSKRTRENEEKHESLTLDHDDTKHQLQSLPSSNDIPNRDLRPIYDQPHISYTGQSHDMEGGHYLFRVPPYHYQRRYTPQDTPPNPQLFNHHPMNMPFLGGCGTPACFEPYYGSHHCHSHSTLEHHHRYHPNQDNFDHRHFPHPHHSCCNFCGCGFPRSHHEFSPSCSMRQMSEQRQSYLRNCDSYHHHHHSYHSEPSWFSHPNSIEPSPFHIHTSYTNQDPQEYNEQEFSPSQSEPSWSTHHTLDTHNDQHSFSSMVTPSQQHNKNDDDVKQNDSLSEECEDSHNTQKKKKRRIEETRPFDPKEQESDAGKGLDDSSDNPFLAILDEFLMM